MPNEIFRHRLQTAIQNAQKAYTDASLVDHAGLRGRVREILAEQLLTLVLPSPFEIGTGKIVDSYGAQSAETDIIVYSKSILPPILYSARDGIFPVEASFLALEVKSRLTSFELDDAMTKASRLRKLSYISGLHSPSHEAIAHELTPVISVVFAFGSDLVSKDELERYSERDPEWKSNPLIRAICVIGHGYWWFNKERSSWIVHPPTPDLEEVVEFLALASNTAIYSLKRRGQPRLGKYLMTDRSLGEVQGSSTLEKMPLSTYDTSDAA